ncbi:MAG: aminoglycoside phosphotransferase family protein [Dehalococcoidia bacterium]
MTVDAQYLLAHINARHGASFELSRRYQHGEQGAYALVDPSGRRSVLKWHESEATLPAFQNAGRATEILCARGYPAPRYLLVDSGFEVSYSIQEALPGSPVREIGVDRLPQLLQLNEVQAGLAVQAELPAGQWPAQVADPVLYGGDDYCLLETMQQHSAVSRELLAVLQQFVLSHRDVEYRTTDIVHFDFNPLNLLTEQGEISGVIDWDSACAGDRAFDVATLLFYSYLDEKVRMPLWRHLLKQVRPEIAAVYLSHLILRQVEWSIRCHSAEVANHRLHIAQEVVADLGRLRSGGSPRLL